MAETHGRFRRALAYFVFGFLLWASVVLGQKQNSLTNDHVMRMDLVSTLSSNRQHRPRGV
jgi:hypothetical protein